MTGITCQREDNLSAADYIDVLAGTTLAPLRPLGNPARISEMLAGSDLIVTARNEGGRILGLARCISDGAWVCYCAELAVCEDQQGKGIGRRIIERCMEILGPRIGLALLAEPEAEAFYDRIGMKRMQGFFIARTLSD